MARFVSAYEADDVQGLMAVFTDDIVVSMPPIPLEYEGRDAVAELFDRIFGSGRRSDLVPTRPTGSRRSVPTSALRKGSATASASS